MPWPAAMLLAMIFGVSACNSSTQALDTSAATGKQAATTEQLEAEKKDAEQDKAREEKTATVIQQKASVSQKGTYIRAVVNGEAITNYDIARRVKFRRLRKVSASTEASLDELIDEKLKLQEAKGRGTLATNAIVDRAFADFAKSNRATPKRIAGDLDRMGIGASHFKEFIRTQISWSRTVGGKLQSETSSKSQGEAIFELRKAGEQKPQTTEYRLQQIIFVVPPDKRKGLLKARKDEALAFRQRFSGCENSIQLAKELRDVAVKELGRMMLPELPPLWKEDIEKTEKGGTTPPKETDKGIEVLAVCDARLTSDDRAAQLVNQAKTFEALEEKGSAAGDDYLAELRKNATIIHR